MPQEARKKRAAAKSRLEQARTQMYQDLVLECGERLFAESGFAPVTMRDIAGEAGISPKTLYATYASKDDIYAEIARRRSVVLLEGLRDALGSEGSVLERMYRATRMMVGFLVEHRAFFRIMMRESRSWGLLPSGDPSEGGSASWRAGHRMQSQLMKEGIEAGLFYEGDPDLMAAVSLALVQVYLAAALEVPGEPDPDAIAKEIHRQLQRSLRELPAEVDEATSSD